MIVGPALIRHAVAQHPNISAGSPMSFKAENRPGDLTQVPNQMYSLRLDTSSVQDANSATTVSTKAEDCRLPMQQVHELSLKAHQLGLEQQEHLVATQHLEKRLVRCEKMYADLIRESLELHRSLEQRRKEIARDKSDLEKQRTSAKDKGNEIGEIMAQITLISTANVTSGFIKEELSTLQQQVHGMSQK